MTLILGLQIGQWLETLGENWVNILAGAVAIALLYLMSALMLDWPLPFEKKKGKEKG